MLSCEYCEIFKNSYFEEHLQTAASDNSKNFKKFAQTNFIMANINFINLEIKNCWVIPNYISRTKSETFVFNPDQYNIPFLYPQENIKS